MAKSPEYQRLLPVMNWLYENRPAVVLRIGYGDPDGRYPATADKAITADEAKGMPADLLKLLREAQ